MHFKMSPAICFNLDQSKIVLSGNGFNVSEMVISVYDRKESILEKGKMMVNIIFFSFFHNGFKGPLLQCH